MLLRSTLESKLAPFLDSAFQHATAVILHLRTDQLLVFLPRL